MRKGQQAAVETPGNNEKRYLAGSIHWRTGQVILGSMAAHVQRLPRLPPPAAAWLRSP